MNVMNNILKKLKNLRNVQVSDEITKKYNVQPYYNYTIGIVIPIYQTKFIHKLIQKILNTVNITNYCICIVNDGKSEIANFLSKYTWPQNVEILNLSKNYGFAGANNAGWKYLTKKFPNIKYLGTLNDDTIPRFGWLDAMVNVLKIYPNTGMAAPIMETREGWLGTRKNYAVYQPKNIDKLWVCIRSKIDTDTFVLAVGGFCFLALREVLEDVGYFEEAYHNAGEDLDLCFKLILKGWRIVVCKDARVFHYGGKSRYLKGTNTDLDLSRKLLIERWGYDFYRPNSLFQKN
jgi:GT2 family glycosyltransferase